MKRTMRMRQAIEFNRGLSSRRPDKIETVVCASAVRKCWANQVCAKVWWTDITVSLLTRCFAASREGARRLVVKLLAQHLRG